MFQVRFHGRGGQGVVTAAELLASAAFREDRHAQAFPSFGSERMGAPVMSFCRIDDKPIRTREPVTEPDALIIQDPTLLHQPDLFAGPGPDGYVLVNSLPRDILDAEIGRVLDMGVTLELNTVVTDILAELTEAAGGHAGAGGGFAAAFVAVGAHIDCGICAAECPCGAITMEPERT